MTRGSFVLILILILILILMLCAALCGHPARADGPDWPALVHQVVVSRADGGQEQGSAVAVGGDRLATNCHVLRGAQRIEVVVAGRPRPATVFGRDAYRDVCFLNSPGLAAPALPVLGEAELKVGMAVVAVGYPGGRFAVGEGRIVGLHRCNCGGNPVIQTSAPFDRGASGGGLFDRQGRLVGLVSFKSRAGGNFHFALPADWLQGGARGGEASELGDDSFWERPGRDSGYFLVACDMGARKDWGSLRRLAEEWTRQEADNPEAWMALGRSERGIGNDKEAALAFQRALALDPERAEARLALQQLEFDLKRDLLESARP